MEITVKTEIRTIFEKSIDLNVDDFLNCETISHLKYEIYKRINPVPENIKDYSLVAKSVDIPDDFLLLWKEKTGFLPGNVMTLNRKKRAVANAEYSREYEGETLNTLKSKCPSNHSFGEYDNFRFNENQRYITYWKDSESGYYITENLLFAEEIGPSKTRIVK